MNQPTGVETLFDQLRSVPYQRPARHALPARDLPVVVLLGPRGSGKTHLLGRLAKSAEDRPTVLVRLPDSDGIRPREVVARLAAGLSHPVPRLPRLHFPRLAIGLVTLAIDALPLDTRSAERQLREALLKPREVDARVEGLAQIVDTLKGVAFSTVPLLGAISTAARLSPLVPLSLSRWSPLKWYRNGGDPFSELRILHQRSQSTFAQDQEIVDAVMCQAFLADLRAAYPRPYDTTRPVALLDDVDHPGGRQFLELLVRIRADDRTVADPLVVFGTASDSSAVPGPASQDLQKRQMRWAEQASFDDWLPLREKPLNQTDWDFYCVRLRDLAPDVVQDMNPDVRGQLPDVPTLVHGLTRGHAHGTALLLGAAARELTAHWTLAEVTRSLLRPPGDDLDQGPAGVTVKEALDHLLHGFSEEQQAALTLWAAARDYPTARDSGLLNSFAPEVRQGLPRALEPRLWVVDPEVQDAAARGGVRGPGELGLGGTDTGRVLHPWLRLLLLARLARPAAEWPEPSHLPAGLTSWDGVHAYLQQKAHDSHRTLDVYYHALAREQVKLVVDHLAARLVDPIVRVERWLCELYTITGAPLKEPADARESPVSRAKSLAAEAQYPADPLKRDLALLVSALCLAGDARNRIPVHESPTLKKLIADGFTKVADHSHRGNLSDEATKFE